MDRLHALIAHLSSSRMSLRDIGDVVGFSHEQVRRVLHERPKLRSVAYRDLPAASEALHKLKYRGTPIIVAGAKGSGRTSLVASLLDSLADADSPLAIIDGSIKMKVDELSIPAQSEHVVCASARHPRMREHVFGPWLESNDNAIVVVDDGRPRSTMISRALDRQARLICTMTAATVDEAMLKMIELMGTDAFSTLLPVQQPALLFTTRGEDKNAVPQVVMVKPKQLAEVASWPSRGELLARLVKQLRTIEHDEAINGDPADRPKVDSNLLYDVHVVCQPMVVEHDGDHEQQAFAIRYHAGQNFSLPMTMREAVAYSKALENGFTGRHDRLEYLMFQNESN